MIRAISAISMPILMVCSLVGSCLVVQHLAAPHIMKRADGRPMDYAGDRMKCDRCGGIFAWQEAHRYRCEHCKLSATLRYNSNGGPLLIRHLD